MENDLKYKVSLLAIKTKLQVDKNQEKETT